MMCQGPCTILQKFGRVLTKHFAFRYFETDHALRSHWRSKVHKRRCKQLKEPAYTIEESERAAGLGREGKRPTSMDTSTPMAMEQEA